MSVARRAARLGALPLAAAAVVLSAPAASAHVGVTPSSTSAGAYSVLTFSTAHGCGESPTTTMTFQLPEQIIAVSPTINPGWDVEKVMQELDEPVEGAHGVTYTERVAEVVYTAKTPLANGFRETFELQLQLPDAEGERLAFPVVQGCEEGENAWVQTVADGEEEPESPAPFIDVTAAEAGDHHGGGTEEASDEHGDEHAEEAAAGTSIGWPGIVLGALGLAVGAVALVRTKATA